MYRRRLLSPAVVWSPSPVIGLKTVRSTPRVDKACRAIVINESCQFRLKDSFTISSFCHPRAKTHRTNMDPSLQIFIPLKRLDPSRKRNRPSAAGRQSSRSNHCRPTHRTRFSTNAFLHISPSRSIPIDRRSHLLLCKFASTTLSGY